MTQDELDQTHDEFKLQFGDKPRYVHHSFLAHLSQRLIGEQIEYIGPDKEILWA